MFDFLLSISHEDIGAIASIAAVIISVWAALFARREVGLLKREFEATKYPDVNVQIEIDQTGVDDMGSIYTPTSGEIFFTAKIYHPGGPANMPLVDTQATLQVISPKKRRFLLKPQEYVFCETNNGPIVKPDGWGSIAFENEHLERFLSDRFPDFLADIESLRPSGQSVKGEEVNTRSLTLKLVVKYKPAVTGAKPQTKPVSRNIQAYYHRSDDFQVRPWRWVD